MLMTGARNLNELGLTVPVVKICGISTPEHALVAGMSGADMIGMVFARSRRQVSVQTAKAIRTELDRLEVRPLTAGVFVNETPASVVGVAREVCIDVVQLSGDETPEEVAIIAQNAPDVALIKALRFPATTTVHAALETCMEYVSLGLRERFRLLIDSYHPGEYGGTGQVADWFLAAALAAQMEVFLAGGLNPQNVAEAMATVAPWGVDVSSGVEREGVKDADLIRDFVSAAHAAYNRERIA
jgi:phosphoribosylanthranilate isomerase